MRELSDPIDNEDELHIRLAIRRLKTPHKTFSMEEMKEKIELLERKQREGKDYHGR